MALSPGFSSKRILLAVSAICGLLVGACGSTTSSSTSGGGGAPVNGSATSVGLVGNGASPATSVDGCNPKLGAIIRDFKKYNNGAGHPDFETFTGDGLKGIVESTLGADHKPVYAHSGSTEFTTGPSEFAQWYNDVDGVNKTIPFTIVPIIDASGLASYTNDAFFPIDNMGWGNEDDGHNYAFTTELHMTFKYKGGETFSFTGDDDLWVFMNNHLAIDLGGLHLPQQGSVALDEKAVELGIAAGNEYALDLFHAERHTVLSNFSIQSTLEFTNCSTITY